MIISGTAGPKGQVTMQDQVTQPRESLWSCHSYCLSETPPPPRPSHGEGGAEQRHGAS